MGKGIIWREGIRDLGRGLGQMWAGATLGLIACVLPPRLQAASENFVAFESGQVRPLVLAPDGKRLFALNTPDNRVEIYAVDDDGLSLQSSISVGLEPVALALHDDSELWVVNHLSDSISIIDLASEPASVVRTLWVGDEPRDVVFAGSRRERAFITTAHRGQNSPWNNADNPGQLTTPGIGRADVWVFDADNLGTRPGGTALSVLSLFTDTPRALAVSADGRTVYAAGFYTGNRTTVVPESNVCLGGSTARACTVDRLGGAPGGLPAPNVDAAGIRGPETGLIVKFDGSRWVDQLARVWDGVIRFRLPDTDVFAIDATATPPRQTRSWAGVGTVLFNMAVNPVNGKIYVSNSEARNEVRLEGPRDPGSPVATVQGRLHQSRITVLDGASVLPRHLNKHIDYNQRPAPVGVAERSLAQPLDMAVSDNGRTLYVAAYGSSKIGVFDTASLEDNSFVPSAASHIEVDGGGPSGLALDEARNRLYVLTRFDNSVKVINLTSRRIVQEQAMPNPEPAEIINGRRFLYDARFSSSNGEAACGSCHIFGDLDALAWDLGNPTEISANNPGPFKNVSAAPRFHPLKGPMTTQSLRGMANHGPMHWRGDRTGGNEAPSSQPDSGSFNERVAFSKFSGAFVGLLGRSSEPTTAEMTAFTDFILKVTYPPNPIRNLDNSLTPRQQAGRNVYFGAKSDSEGNCNTCHRLDPTAGFFGTDGQSANDGFPQLFKVAQLRNLYEKVGKFGAASLLGFNSSDIGPTGDQIRGYGFLHNGGLDTLFRFFHFQVFTFPGESTMRDVEQFLFAYDSNLSPVVGQQVTASSNNLGEAGARIDLLEARAAAGQCEVFVKGVVNGRARGYQRLSTGNYRSDIAGEALLTASALRGLIVTPGANLTYSCAPVGSGRRMGIDRDCDDVLDGDDLLPTSPDRGVGCLTGSAPPSVPAPDFMLRANPGVITAGSFTTLTWTAASNASSCVAVDGWVNNPGTEGSSQIVTPTATTTYTLICTGPGGGTSRSATVTVNSSAPSTTVSVSATPSTIILGQSSTLRWSSTNASSCTVSGASSGPAPVSGSIVLRPTRAGVYTYTLTCSGTSGSSASQSAVLRVNAS